MNSAHHPSRRRSDKAGCCIALALAFGLLVFPIVDFVMLQVSNTFEGQGRGAYARGDYEYAERSLRYAYLSSPRASPVLERGLALYHLGRYDEALQELTNGVQRGGRTGPWSNAMGVTLISLRRKTEAREWLSDAVSRSPQNAVYLANLAVVEDGIGDHLDARRHRAAALSASGGASAHWTLPVIAERDLRQHTISDLYKHRQ